MEGVGKGTREDSLWKKRFDPLGAEAHFPKAPDVSPQDLLGLHGGFSGAARSARARRAMREHAQQFA